jgi:uncharacterized protein YecE (DUF72 family)
VYAKWAQATPDDFRFAVKVPRAITHDHGLRRARLRFAEFLHQTAGLSNKRGPLLLQLPPSHIFDVRVVGRFLDLVRAHYDGIMVCEPRHESWFTPKANAVLARHHVARVAADPPPAPGADAPGGWDGMVYYRLHGSPRKYWSSYESNWIAALAKQLRAATVPAWCVFDNTASGAALENAWALQAGLGAAGSSRTIRLNGPRADRGEARTSARRRRVHGQEP